MKTIWKFELEVTDEQLWAIVNPEARKESIKLITIGTGHPVPRDLIYIGTYQINDGRFVFHIFMEEL
jgi:hypothetical protein